MEFMKVLGNNFKLGRFNNNSLFFIYYFSDNYYVRVLKQFLKIITIIKVICFV